MFKPTNLPADMWTLTIILSSLPITLSVVNCGKACSECRLKKLHPQLVDVYCAMCTECQETGSYGPWDQRRSMLDDWENYDSYLIRKLRTEDEENQDLHKEITSEESSETTCPTQPPCSSYEDEEPTTCPPIIPCKSKKPSTRPSRHTKRTTKKITTTKGRNDCVKNLSLNLTINCCNEPCKEYKEDKVTENFTEPTTSKEMVNDGEHILYVGIPKDIDESSQT